MGKSVLKYTFIIAFAAGLIVTTTSATPLESKSVYNSFLIGAVSVTEQNQLVSNLQTDDIQLSSIKRQTQSIKLRHDQEASIVSLADTFMLFIFGVISMIMFRWVKRKNA